MSIKNLLLVLPKPKISYEVSSPQFSWKEIEEKLSTSLPSDYKEFIEIYGSGRIDSFLSVFNPFSSIKRLNLLNQIEIHLDVFRNMSDLSRNSIPFPIFPEAFGLLSIGLDDNGNSLFWNTIGDPDNWKMILLHSRSPKFEKFDLNITEFLALILSKKIKSDIYPIDFPSKRPKFLPYSPNMFPQSVYM